MNPGKLNRRITFQKHGETTNENGFKTDGWVDVQTVWACIKTLKGKEFYEASTTQNQNTTRFIIRYRKGLHPDMRIKYNNRYFDIEAIINDDEMNKTLTIHAKERVQ
ncbi:phage head closure protein [Paenibacillus larvae]|uniref:Head-tail adaptor protein n=10 Tax=root TaxID=1 RepID=A0A0K2CYU4_9CAUD|nr:phage head closure protein [Paenibacillus larvae]YP_009193821.1 head closure Hc1 [Paenibacillus phage Harrison]YP_009196107.1 head closure Hc1 [Paenibacillus phage Vegas]ALA12574.1 head-tail adaptor protein [Paenibacillus phage Paisley]ALA12744.1 head-tail adaptor protein [Paenibacillus phage Hayley]ALA12828.1 head-tail adaptor protein [Paenibacillus phage Vadim]ALA12914.1 head-tail adaptor protein [Paenibacillus phage Diane]UYE92033.1 head-to-tail adaptor [Paenibacillus phage LunBun]UYE